MTLKASFTLITGAILATGALAQGRPDLVAQSMADPGRKPVPYQVLVQFRAGVAAAAQDGALAQLGARADHALRRAATRRDGKGDLTLVNLPPGLALATAVRYLGQTAEVEFVEPNWIYQHQAVSNDTYATNNSLWGMYGAGTTPANIYGSGAAVAWANNKTDCSGVWVGIIDEGVMRSHPDLAANMAVNPGEIPGDGIDNDGNGLIDDVNGWDFAGNDKEPFDGVGDDHGTHVAGTIGGVGGNGQGVAGVCWKVKMINAKFLGSTGGTTANAVKAVDYLTNLKTRHGLNLVATNNSWGGGGYSQALFDAISRANQAGILFIAAAGNAASNNDVTPSYPANYALPNVISVASITSTGALSSFSNYGATQVDIGAPGSAIWSTVPKTSRGRVVAGYASYNGTSMATPHVTGAAALYAARNPGATAAQIRAAILGQATPTPSLVGKTVTGGRLNVSGF